MADTVSNSKRTIATKGSSHTAMQTAPDVCIVPPAVPTPFGNTVPTTRLGAGKSANTFISNNPITLNRTKIGPVSDAAHAGVLGGVKTGSYRGWAQATGFSTDLFVEGGPVVRTGDPTKQNNGNTVGSVLAGIYVASMMDLEQQAKKKCVIDSFKGVCDHGRQLGWPSAKKIGKPNYLEILDTDTVVFNTVRKDITKTPHEINPACRKAGEHTHWKATSIKFLSPLEKGELEEKGTEFFVVPGSLAISKIVLKLMGHRTDHEDGRQDHDERLKHKNSKPASDEPNWDEKRREATRGLRNGSPAHQSALSGVNKQMNAYQQANSRAAKANPQWSKAKQKGAASDRATNKEAAKDMAAAAVKANAKEIIMYWLWRSMPPEIHVNATSCGSARRATLVVYPNKLYKFELSFSKERKKATKYSSRQQERQAQREAERAAARKEASYQRAMARFDKADAYFQAVRAGLKATKTVCDVATKIASYSREKLIIKFLVGFTLKWEIKYKECTQTKGRFPAKLYTPAHVGRYWCFAVESKPIIGVDGEVNFSLLNFVAPGVGRFLRRFKIVRADIVFSAIIGLYANVSVARDEYDFCTDPGAEIGIDITLAMALVFGTAGVDVLALKASFPARGTCRFAMSKKPSTLFMCRLEGRIRSNFTITVFPDRWWEIEAVAWAPENLRAEFTGKWNDLFTSPG